MEEFRYTGKRKLVDLVDLIADEGGEVTNDWLPTDPFGVELNNVLTLGPVGMDIDLSWPRIDSSGTDFNLDAPMVVMASLIQVFGLDTSGFETDDESEDKEVDKNLYAELNFVWNSLMKFEQETEDNVAVDARLAMCCNMFGENTEYQNGFMKDNHEVDGGEPADALFFALGYLGLEDLLSMEMVCKSMHVAVQNDPLLWRNIHIDSNLKITDDNLIRLTNRAQGTLRILSLVQCLQITDHGLKHVLQTNPGLTKLNVRGCIRIHVGNLLHNLKVLNSGVIKHLRIGGLPGATNQNFKELQLLLGSDANKKPVKYKPRFHLPEQLRLSLDDERDIDIDICPRCQEVRDVYDCPAESCQVKAPSSVQTCRACILCIARCTHCGCCLDDRLYEETFYLNFICFDCVVQFSSNGHGKLAFHGVWCRL